MELFQVFNEISREESPSVRRAAAANIGELAAVGDSVLLNNIINLHTNLIKDSVDIVKVHTIQSTKFLLAQSDDSQKKSIISNFISSINKDKSWRVKYAAAEAIADIVNSFDISFNELNFLPTVMLFLKDNEPEVRSSAISKLNNFIKFISKEKFISSIIPILQEMITDNNHHVRSLLATTLLNICENENIDDEIFEKYLYDMINKITKDDLLEVKNSAVCAFDKLGKFMGSKGNSEKLINTMIIEISKDTKWRIRFSLCERLKIICEKFDIGIFKTNFFNILSVFFMDHASEIRKITVEIFRILLESDLEGNKILIWEKIKSSLLSTNYILRIEGLKAIDYLKENFIKSNKSNNIGKNNESFLCNEIIPFILLLKDDRVPNVRFNIVNLLKNLYFFLSKSNSTSLNNNELSNKIRNSIVSLNSDSDLDVKFFSNEALEEISKLTF
jgi:serine/threonine-protein phosphatase 2A regulatory subunit A